MDVECLIDYGDYVSPQQQKQLIPTPTSYEEALKEVQEGEKQIYEYIETEVTDYFLDTEDEEEEGEGGGREEEEEEEEKEEEEEI